MATPKAHIEEIRRRKFSIGGEEINPLTEDLHQAVKNLSAELYAKDVHFLMELIQNAEDNEYTEGVVPSLEFIITSRDITATGALATLLIFNNEKGFSPKNIDSICSVGRSTKKGNREQGFIGEKGIGFKSVFLITAQPYIFSNGYQIRFKEDPCSHCNVGFIVPEWVDENPTLSDIKSIYGSDKTLPTTAIILPLKSDKINPVKLQLSNLHPEILLFLSKIKRLSVKEDNQDPSLNTVNTIAISSEMNFAMRKNIDAESYTLHLSAEENSNQSMKQCSYYMWKQKFMVRSESKVERRMEADEFWITLAFPFKDRLHRGMTSPGVYAFLPTEMITNFPFIIQADFLLASSRETILLDDKWNQGILDRVPSTFISAFISLVKSSETAPVSSLPPMFTFIPVSSSSYPKFNLIREAIRTKLLEEDIIPSESFTDQKFFHKSKEVGRLMPAFWSILMDAKVEGISLHNLSSYGKFILSSSFDSTEYDDVLNFLGVQEVSDEWYPNFLGGSNLVRGVPDEVYVKLLVFISGNWVSKFQNTSMRSLPLVKYVNQHGIVSLCSSASVSESNVMRIYLSAKFDHSPWLIKWNEEFRCSTGRYFIPTSTEVDIRSCEDKERILEWLETHVKVVSCDVLGFARVLLPSLDRDTNLVVAYAHFLYHSLEKNHISKDNVTELCRKLPLLNNSGVVTKTRNGVLVPGKGSNWAALMGSNPWSYEDYIELGEAYLKQGHFAGEHTPSNQLMEFLKEYVGAADIPLLFPPNSGIPAVSGPLTLLNALLLLEWIRNLKYGRSHFPDEFLESIKKGSWLRVTLSGASSGYRPPSQSFFPSVAWGKIFQNVAVLIDVPLIDQDFYGGSMIEDYKEELKMLGVMSEYGEACEYIGNHFMSLLSSSMTLTRSNVFSILLFIRFLREKYLPVENFVSSISGKSWLKTTHGVKSPGATFLFDAGWTTAAKICNIPFLDHNFYGEDLRDFKDELELLGVVVDLKDMRGAVVQYLKPSNDLEVRQPETLLLLLMCISQGVPSDKSVIIRSLVNNTCLNTNSGYRSPGKCFLPDPEWSCLLQVFDSIPVVDVSFYGDNIWNYKREMEALGVVVDLDEAIKEFCKTFRQQASSLSIQKAASFLACYRKLSRTRQSILSEIRSCITEVKWLRTKLEDYKSPENCILFGEDWECISEICRLPFLIDKEIQGYKEELKSIGVVVDLQDGINFVISGLKLPKVMSPDNVLALLKCICMYLNDKKEETLPEGCLSRVSKDWLKTHAGYLPPNRCILYDPKWALDLKPTDGPFIDEEFYLDAVGDMIKYRKELHAIGVIVDVKEACQSMSSYIYSHSNTSIIMRIYDFLRQFDWKLADDRMSVWIPQKATWVSHEECVLHDKEDLFNSRLNVLDKHYDRRYLVLFSDRVRWSPSMDDYYKLWKEWEVSRDSLSIAECCAFWGYVSRHWSSQAEKMFAEGLKKLPVEDSGKVIMSDKCDAFIADDLLLKDIFAHRPIFVWYPKTSTGGHDYVHAPNRVKLLEMYKQMGVWTISRYIDQKGSFSDSVPPETEKSNWSDVKSLVRLILSFLSNPPINMEFEKRQESVKCLADVTVLESVEPVTVSYKLPLVSSGEVVSGTSRRLVRWEREASKLFMQQNACIRPKDRIEYASHLGEEISKGVIWDENEENINALSELIKMGYLLEFDEEAMDFLIKSKNLQVFEEDIEFLDSAVFQKRADFLFQTRGRVRGRFSRGRGRFSRGRLISRVRI